MYFCIFFLTGSIMLFPSMKISDGNLAFVLFSTKCWVLTYFVSLVSFIPRRKNKSLAKSVRPAVLQKDSVF